MFTSVSVRNLIDGGRQTVLSISGISFAIILIFMQLGFLGAVLDTAVLFYNNLNFDLVARSPNYFHFCDPKDFPRPNLNRIKNVKGVAGVMPYHVSLARWSYAEKAVQRGILIMGVDPQGQTFSSVSAKVDLPDLTLLSDDRLILVDEKSRAEFLGFDNFKRFSPSEVGLRMELNQKICEIAGLFRMGTGLAANGAAIINEDGFQRIYPGYGPNRVALGLIRLNEPESRDPAAARDAVYQILGMAESDTRPIEILTRKEAVQGERLHWVVGTPIGFIFFTGVVMSFVVGVIIVFIVLSADINRQIGEYATLKAMGYRNGFLYRVVLEQAILLALASYVISYFVSVVLYQVVGTAANLPITMTGGRQVMVLASSLLMCCFSAVIAMKKLRKADPADLF